MNEHSASGGGEQSAESATEGTVRALWWFRVLCGVCVVLGLAALGIGLLAWTGQPAADSSMNAREFYAAAKVLVAVGSLLTVPFAAAPFLPKTPVTWGVHLFLVTVAMFFIIPMVIAIPVAIGWFGDALKRQYGMATSSEDATER